MFRIVLTCGTGFNPEEVLAVKKFLCVLSLVLAILAMTMVLACGQAEKEKAPAAKATAKPDIGQEELTASVPAPDRWHEVVFPLWHEAYAQKNYDLIKDSQMEMFVKKRRRTRKVEIKEKSEESEKR
jgi:hypothetical protein